MACIAFSPLQAISPVQGSEPNARSISAKKRNPSPCDACRHRKWKCKRRDGATACEFCEEKGKACVVSTHSKPQRRAKSINTSTLQRTRLSRMQPMHDVVSTQATITALDLSGANVGTALSTMLPNELASHFYDLRALDFAGQGDTTSSNYDFSGRSVNEQTSPNYGQTLAQANALFESPTNEQTSRSPLGDSFGPGELVTTTPYGQQQVPHGSSVGYDSFNLAMQAQYEIAELDVAKDAVIDSEYPQAASHAPVGDISVQELYSNPVMDSTQLLRQNQYSSFLTHADQGAQCYQINGGMLLSQAACDPIASYDHDMPPQDNQHLEHIAGVQELLDLQSSSSNTLPITNLFESQVSPSYSYSDASPTDFGVYELPQTGCSPEPIQHVSQEHLNCVTVSAHDALARFPSNESAPCLSTSYEQESQKNLEVLLQNHVPQPQMCYPTVTAYGLHGLTAKNGF